MTMIATDDFKRSDCSDGVNWEAIETPTDPFRIAKPRDYIQELIAEAVRPGKPVLLGIHVPTGRRIFISAAE